MTYSVSVTSMECSEDGGELPETEASNCNRWLCESPKLICWGEELHLMRIQILLSIGNLASLDTYRWTRYF